MSISRILSGTATALILLIAAGCQSSDAPNSLSSASPRRAVVVTGGNAGATTVFLASSDASHAEALSSNGGQICARCQADAAKYFLTGQIENKCPACGGLRTPVTPYISHN